MTMMESSSAPAAAEPTGPRSPRTRISVNESVSEIPADEHFTSARTGVSAAATTSSRVETMSDSAVSLDTPYSEAPVGASQMTAIQQNPALYDVMTMPTDEVSTDNRMNDADEAKEPLQTKESESFSSDDPQIQLDAAEKYMSCVVHIMLFFFLALTVIAVFFMVKLLSQYGFFAFMIISLLLGTIVGIVIFVNRVLKEDSRLRPVRRQIRRWQAVATAVILKEIRDFQIDWNEHLLLTDGSEYNLYDDDEFPTMNVDDAAAAKSSKPKKKRGGRSAIFKIVKPFLKVGGRRRRKRKEKEAVTAMATATEGDHSEAYIPPVV